VNILKYFKKMKILVNNPKSKMYIRMDFISLHADNFLSLKLTSQLLEIKIMKSPKSLTSLIVNLLNFGRYEL
jgi:hypothetical protein